MEASPNINISPMGHIDASIASIDAVLAAAPTSKQNADHLLALEGELYAELEIDERLGWLPHDILEGMVKRFHHTAHPELLDS